MSTEFAVVPPSSAGADPTAGTDTHGSILRGPDGVFIDPSTPAGVVLADVDRLFQSGRFITQLDYPAFVKALFGVGADAPRTGDGLVRLGAGIATSDPAQRALYREARIRDGQANYMFEAVFLFDPARPDSEATPARLDTDEFVADMWNKGIRFGIEIDAVRTTISSGATGLVTVARKLAPAPGIDATIIEVSDDIHRSDAPKLLANGKLDLMSFQNRFPQIKQGARLLKKVPRQDGSAGVELSGAAIAPSVGADVDLAPMAGAGTKVERTGGGEFLVALQNGFLSVDPKTSQLSIDAKIVSRDGVSSRTTGNLQLTGDYEEFGEVQEMRVIEGEGITVHADVFGKIISRGGTIVLNRNLVGGSAVNKRGDIVIQGVASGAVIQSSNGSVTLQRAENCVISGTRVRVEHAVNCEIIGDEVSVGQAEGCALAGRQVAVETSAPRRDSEMIVLALRPDCGKIDDVIAQIGARVAQFGELVARHKASVEALTSEPEVRRYVTLASKVRKNELTLTSDQLPMFQKMALAVGPQLKAIGKLSLDVKAAETEQAAGQALIDKLVQQRSDSAVMASVKVQLLRGETQIRALPFNPDGSSTYDLSPRDIKARLRSASLSSLLFAGASGNYEWDSEADGQ